jgi:hypothetical protein
MLLTHPILVFVAKAFIGEKKHLKKPHLKLVCQTDSLKNACYFLIEYDVILLRRMSWPISSLEEDELANQQSG